MEIQLYIFVFNVNDVKFKDTLSCVSNRSQEYWVLVGSIPYTYK